MAWKLKKGPGDSQSSDFARSDLVEPSFRLTVTNLKRAATNPTGISKMKSIAEAALEEDEGIDFGSLSHEERNQLLLFR